MTVYRSEYNSYIFQLFQTPIYYRQVSKNLGATINSINNSDLLDFTFPFPEDTKEMKAISKVLGKMDEEMDLLNKLLQKFKLQKEALLQQLLTAKKMVKVN
jgi:type I restriction enzyme S subunit